MPSFGERSLTNLNTCDDRLITVARSAINYADFSVIEGARSVERQQELFLDGKTTLDGITKLSNHNQVPSLAFDLLPYPAVMHGINVWDDRDRFTLFAGFILGVAAVKGINLTWGGDWDNDGSMANTGFLDLPHFEIRTR